MRTAKVSLEECGEATGVVVAIDVLRAFSTAAYAFGSGAIQIWLAGTIEQAFALKARLPDAWLLGEDHGRRVPGFDFSNSPSELAAVDLAGRTLIQRTTAGTQGIVRSRKASALLAASFCNARATARYLRAIAPTSITFVITGRYLQYGDEDLACADYIEALLAAKDPDVGSFLERVVHSAAAAKFLIPTEPDLPAADVEYCTRANRFDFAMVVDRIADHFCMHPI